jgi:hypothetical protein
VVQLLGPRQKAFQARRILEPHLLTEEKAKVWSAISHACDTREGRGEFDQVMIDIRDRLWP